MKAVDQLAIPILYVSHVQDSKMRDDLPLVQKRLA